jgi:micrococcal nuclease
VYEYVAVVRSVHDGDTFRADVDLGFDVWIKNIPFRLLGLNAPEIGSETGRASRDYLRALMPPGTEIVIRTKKDAKEKYGRMLATVLGALGDVNQAMIGSGHALPWDGTGPRPE